MNLRTVTAEQLENIMYRHNIFLEDERKSGRDNDDLGLRDFRKWYKKTINEKADWILSRPGNDMCADLSYVDFRKSFMKIDKEGDWILSDEGWKAMELLRKKGYSFRKVNFKGSLIPKFNYLLGACSKFLGLPNDIFEGCCFDDATIIYSHFDGMTYKKSTFVNCKFVGNHSFVGANLVGCDFTNAQFNNSLFSKNEFECLRDCDFAEANLSNAIFCNNNLEQANFRRSNCSGAKFVNCNLSHSDFNRANLSNAKFVDSNTRLMSVYRADILNASGLSNVADYEIREFDDY